MRFHSMVIGFGKDYSRLRLIIILPRLSHSLHVTNYNIIIIVP